MFLNQLFQQWKFCVKEKIKNKMKKQLNQLKNVIFTAVLMVIGLIILKFIPMNIYGNNILFDASMHIVVASFILYLIYFFIDENKSWRFPYLIFCFFVLTVISIQRIISNAHNDTGILLGVLVSLISIIIPNWNYFKNKFKF